MQKWIKTSRGSAANNSALKGFLVITLAVLLLARRWRVASASPKITGGWPVRGRDCSNDLI